MPLYAPSDMPPLIGISGKQYSGKDQLAAIIMDCFPFYQKVPLALAIKKAYALQHHLTLEGIEKNKAAHRQGLIALGDWGRRQEEDYWLKQALAISGPKIISDVRLKREYALLKAEGAFLIRINASHDVRKQRGQLVSEDDKTECDLDDVTSWDWVVENNGSLASLKSAFEQRFASS